MSCFSLSLSQPALGIRLHLPAQWPQPSLILRAYSAYLMQLWLVLLCVVTLLGRKRGHWLTKPAENKDPGWQQERPPEIPQNLRPSVCRGKRSSNAHSSIQSTCSQCLEAGRQLDRGCYCWFFCTAEWGWQSFHMLSEADNSMSTIPLQW